MIAFFQRRNEEIKELLDDHAPSHVDSAQPIASISPLKMFRLPCARWATSLMDEHQLVTVHRGLVSQVADNGHFGLGFPRFTNRSRPTYRREWPP